MISNRTRPINSSYKKDIDTAAFRGLNYLSANTKSKDFEMIDINKFRPVL